MRSRYLATPLLVLAAPCLVLFTACGGGDSVSGPTTPKIDPTKPAAIALVAGSGQTVRVKSSVPNPPTFKVTNASGVGIPNVTVNFTIVAGGGGLSSTVATTANDGTVVSPAWSVGSAVGTNTIRASVPSVTPAEASATARLPYWTVMVYMAADNTLALNGVENLVQMAVAGRNPEVQVVVQAEFSPTQFQQVGCTSACIGRPNYNTVRYVLDGSVATTSSNPFMGTVTDIGNRNMTDPAQLTEFMQWARTTAPSQHTMLVLWNHGAGAGGLITDDTSAPHAIMSLSQLATALAGGGAVDVIDFDMCLMGGYETLAAVQKYASAVVASEETEPGDGLDYTGMLRAVYAAPTSDAAAVAVAAADAYDAYYAGKGLSTTIAAYAMSGFGPVDAAVTQLANAMLHIPPSAASTLAAGARAAQRYEVKWLVDAVDLSDSLKARTSDAAVIAGATAVRAAVTSPSFLLRNKVRSGTTYGANPVDRSRGLQIVLPADAKTAMPSAGSYSFSAYQQSRPSAAWTTFLSAWIPTVALGGAFVDRGTNGLTLYEVWDSTLVSRGGDVDLILLEPDGEVYGPLLGTVSPSGQFSPDSRVKKTYVEGWSSNRYVEAGTFYFLAWLTEDPKNLGATLNVAYRLGSGSFQSLYGAGTYPFLSLSRSFLSDPSPTDQKLLSNYYSDLKVVATWQTTAASGSLGPVDDSAATSGASAGTREIPHVTTQQLRTLQRAMLTQQRNGRPR
jgi:hypothetical protein